MIKISYEYDNAICHELLKYITCFANDRQYYLYIKIEINLIINSNFALYYNSLIYDFIFITMPICNTCLCRINKPSQIIMIDITSLTEKFSERILILNRYVY